MKKTLSLILFVFLFVGCNNIKSSENQKENNAMGDICITEIEQLNIEWDQIQSSVKFNEEILKETDAIATNQNALDVGVNIIEEFHREGKLSEYTLMSITHSIKDNVWCFEYSIDQRDRDIDDLIDCGCLYVVIDGNNGTLIKAWLEE